jgi:hypothetical protein
VLDEPLHTPTAHFQALDLDYESLTGPHRGWLTICQNWRAGRVVLEASLDENLAALSSRELAWPEGRSGERHPNRAVAAARATWNVAVALSGAPDGARLISASAAYWKAANLTSADASPEIRGSGTDEIGRVKSLIAANAPAAVAPFMALLVDRLAGSSPRTGRTVSAPVLFDCGQTGEASTLLLTRLTRGPVGLHPDPGALLFFAADEAFSLAVARAWGQSAAARHGYSVLWSLRTGDQVPTEVRGASLGGAFAVALAELNRISAPARRCRTRGFDRHCAISATLDARGALAEISGMVQKLDAAKEAGLRVVTAAHSTEGAAALHAAADARRLDLALAADVSEAIRISRKPRPTALIGLTLLLVLASVGGLSFYLADKHQQAVNHRNVLVRQADRLVADAAAAGTADGLSRQAQAQLLLAAQSLALRAGDPSLADRVVRSPLTAASGILQEVAPSLTGPVEHLSAVARGGDLVVDSGAGQLVLVAPDTYDILGSFSEPPGTVTLVQPLVRSVAPLANSDLFAVVFQNPLNDVRSGATLEIFSATSRLTQIGEVKDFTLQKVRAAVYWHRGTRLITASASSVTYWDTSASTPRQLFTCRWRPRAAAALGVPTGALDDRVAPRPLLVLSSGAVAALPSWTLSPTSRCPARVVSHPLPGLQLARTFDTSVSANFSADNQLRVFGLTRAHTLLESTSSRPRPAVIATQVDATGSYNGAAIPIVRGPSPAHLEFLTPGRGDAVTSFASFTRVGLPAVAAGGVLFAESTRKETRGAIESLDPAHTTYIAGGLVAGQAHAFSEAVAANRNAVAIAYSSAIGIYRLARPATAEVLPLPSHYGLAPGDGRIGATLSVSADGRYCAAILDGPAAAPGFPRRHSLYVFDTALHQVTALTPPISAVPPGIRPLSVQFVPSSDQLIVSYLPGALLSYSTSQGGWTPHVWRTSAQAGTSVAAAVGDDGVYRIEYSGGTQVVAKYDLSGRGMGTWPLRTLRVTITADVSGQPGQIVPLGADGALLVLDSGTGYRLEKHGRLSGPIRLGSANVVGTAAVRARHEVVVAGYRGTTILDYDTNVLLPARDPFGPLIGIAATPDGNYLVGSDPLHGASALIALGRQTITAALCQTAGGEVPPAIWSAFVGRLAPYERVCVGSWQDLREAASVARVSHETAAPTILQTVPASDVAELIKACAAANTRSTAIGSLSWNLTPGLPDLEGAGVVCRRGTPIWLVPSGMGPRVEAGGTPTDPFLLVTALGPATEAGRARLADVIDQSGAVTLAAVTHGSVPPSLSGAEATLVDKVGDLQLATTYTRGRFSRAWLAVKQEPRA